MQYKSAKIWTDGAFQHKSGLAAIGVSVAFGKGRDKQHRLGQVGPWRDPQQAEAAAIAAALDIARDHGCSKVRLFTDSQTLAEVASGRARARSVTTKALRAVIREARNSMKVSVYWVPRAQNQIAHCLAGNALRLTCAANRAAHPGV